MPASLRYEEAVVTPAWQIFCSSAHSVDEADPAALHSREVNRALFAASDVFVSSPKLLLTDRAKQRAWEWLRGTLRADSFRQLDPMSGRVGGSGSSQQPALSAPADPIPHEYVSARQTAIAPESTLLSDAVRRYREDLREKGGASPSTAGRPAHQVAPTDHSLPPQSHFSVNLSAPGPTVLHAPKMGNSSTSSSQKPLDVRISQESSVGTEWLQRRGPTKSQTSSSSANVVAEMAAKIDARSSFPHPVDHSEAERRRLDQKQLQRVSAAIESAFDATPEDLSASERSEYEKHLKELQRRIKVCITANTAIDEEEDEQKAAEVGLQVELLMYRRMLSACSQILKAYPVQNTPPGSDLQQIRTILAKNEASLKTLS
jgi:hypothetical protein